MATHTSRGLAVRWVCPCLAAVRCVCAHRHGAISWRRIKVTAQQSIHGQIWSRAVLHSVVKVTFVCLCVCLCPNLHNPAMQWGCGVGLQLTAKCVTCGRHAFCRMSRLLCAFLREGEMALYPELASHTQWGILATIMALTALTGKPYTGS